MPHAEPEHRSSLGLMSRLSAMMFLQYWSFGAWAVTVGTYIAANTGEEGAAIFSAGFIGYSSAAGAVGSLLSPAIVGILSDRYFSAQRLLAVTQLGCAAANWGMHQSRSEWTFLLWLLAYFHCLFPAIAMTNAIGLRNLRNSQAEYPLVRVAGTLGWIAAGLFVGMGWPWATGVSIEATRIPLAIGAASSLLLAIFALALPATPPPQRQPSMAITATSVSGGAGASRPLAMFLVAAVFACLSSVAYNSYANLYLNQRGFPNPAALMTMGQVSDVVCLFATPWLVARVGLRALFAAGIAAWAVRYGLLAGGSRLAGDWPVYAAIVVHGPCFVFVFVVGVMIVDKLAGEAYRGVAQGLFTGASTGAGNLLGAFAMGLAQTRFLTPAGVSPPPYRWSEFWLVPAAMSVAAGIIYVSVWTSLRPRGEAQPVGDRRDAQGESSTV
ncbi:MAG: MFS transporter [Pirellulales bacterium]|nr:MFS transporter [Pirellulales bacterium]